LEGWKTTLKADPTDWLLDPENPSVRYFALRDLMDNPEGHPEVVEAKNALEGSRWVSRILGKQKPGGYWESEDRPYQPKNKATYWQIIFLSQLGLDKGIEEVSRAVEYIWGFQHEEGGFCSVKEAGALVEYEIRKERASKRGKELPPFEEWAPGRIRESEMSCLTGNVAAALIRMGYAGDPRLRRALDWLVEVQNRDGGWLCPHWRAHIRDKHGCFMGTVPSLEAFSLLSPSLRTPEMDEAVERGVEFLLMHRLYKADHHDFKVIKESWLKLHFPCLFYDILRGLDVVTRLGHENDERIQDALEVVMSKQDQDGRWVLEKTPGNMHTSFGTRGRPSKWVTLNAMKVLKRIYG
jgi:hypothetical protein